MDMRNPARTLARKLPWLALLFALALLRAERGVAEVQGRTGGPSRILHLEPGREPGEWTLSVMGHEAQLPYEEWRLQALEQLERIKTALP